LREDTELEKGIKNSLNFSNKQSKEVPEQLPIENKSFNQNLPAGYLI